MLGKLPTTQRPALPTRTHRYHGQVEHIDLCMHSRWFVRYGSDKHIETDQTGLDALNARAFFCYLSVWQGSAYPVGLFSLIFPLFTY